MNRKASLERDFTYYDLLHVDATATHEQIREAYRASVRTYHPDVNQAANAQHLTSLLNEAWHTLSDSARRKAYDASLNGQKTASGQVQPLVQKPWELLSCERCGRNDRHLRVAVFYFVRSLLVYSRITPFVAILCSGCRSFYSLRSAVYSSLLGPWRFPSGLLLTTKALRVAVRGGERPPDLNARLLRHQAMASLQRHDLAGAKTALVAAQGYEPNPAVGELLRDPEILKADASEPPRWVWGQLVTWAVVPLIAALLVLAVSTLFRPPAVTTIAHRAKYSGPPAIMASARGRLCVAEAQRRFNKSMEHASLEQIRSACIAAANELVLSRSAERATATDGARYTSAVYLSYGGVADVKLGHAVQGYSELSKARTVFRTLAAYSPDEPIRTHAAYALKSIIPWLSTRRPL